MFFRNEYDFLSNFYSCKITYEGITYKNAEAAFQAQKENRKTDRIVYSFVDGRTAKKWGRKAKLKEDWNKVKDNIMYEIVKNKFLQNEELKIKLKNIKEEIVEENYWNDKYWGVCNGIGENKLGKILEKVKKEI